MLAPAIVGQRFKRWVDEHKLNAPFSMRTRWSFHNAPNTTA